jgi:peptidoglycan/xylan/chitin deacetylase (PgdA/CDA1 family)
MITLKAMRAAPAALAAWAGFAGEDDEPTARILVYHGTPAREAGMLERQLRWLKRRFDIVPLGTLAAAAADGRLGRMVALTFDDGLRSNVVVAYPLLRKLAIPATFYVCPGLVDRAAWLWTHEVRFRLARLGVSAQRAESFVEWMKTLKLGARKRVEARLARASRNFEPTAQERAHYDLATWEELRRLDPAIVTIGSHTLTHPILPRTPAAEIETEVRDSRRALEERLQRPIEFFAYPNGDLDDASEAAVRRHYRCAVTAEHGFVRRGADAQLLPRLVAPQGVLRLARRLCA